MKAIHGRGMALARTGATASMTLAVAVAVGLGGAPREASAAMVQGSGTCVVTTTAPIAEMTDVQELSTDLSDTESSLSDDISDAEDSINNTLEDDVVEPLRAGQKQQYAIDQKLAETMMNKDRDLAVERESFRAAQQASQDLGPHGTPDAACGSTTAAGNASAGKSAEDNVNDALARDTAIDYNRGSTSRRDQNDRMLAQNYNSLSATTVMPPTGAIENDQAENAKEFVRNATNPRPEPKLEESASNTGAGRSHEVVRRMKDGQMSLPQTTLNAMVASNMPTIKSNGRAQRQWERMGRTDDNPYVTEEGYLSAMSKLQSEVDARYRSAGWHADVDTATNNGLLQSIAYMNSVSLDIQLRQLEWMQRIGGLLAQQEAREVNSKYNTTLQELRSNAVEAAN